MLAGSVGSLRRAIALAAAIVAAAAGPAPGGGGRDVPVILGLDVSSAYPGTSIRMQGIGFGEPGPLSAIVVDGIAYPGIATYWSDPLIIFTLPYHPGPAAVIQVARDGDGISDPVTLAVVHPERVWFLTPAAGAVISTGSTRIEVAPEFDQGHVLSVLFEYRATDGLLWVPIGTDFDGSAPRAGTTTWIGEGDGWSIRWDTADLAEGSYEVRAIASDEYGQTMIGTRILLIDPTPIAPRILDGESMWNGSQVEPDHVVQVAAEVSDPRVDELILKLFPIKWGNLRILVPVDQDTLGIKDKRNRDVSGMACGPAAAASCLKWFGGEHPALNQAIGDLARRLAKDAGTDSSGTSDAALAAAIKKAIADAGLNADDWDIEVRTDSSKVFYDMVNGLARKKCDVIPLIQQVSGEDVNGDGVADSNDVLGHFITMSSRGTRARDYVTPSGQHIMGRETYVDYMNPATGQKEEALLDDTKAPPRLKGIELADTVKGDAWVESVIVICPPGRGSMDWVPYQEQEIARIPVNGPGIYSHTLLPSDLPTGDSFLGTIGRTVDGVEDGDWRMILIGGYSAVDFTAAPSVGTAPLTVQFSNQSAPKDSVLAWGWDFDGNGSIDATEENPVYTYGVPGTYTVELRAEHPHGEDIERKAALIQVTDPAGTPDASMVPPALSLSAASPFAETATLRFTLPRRGPARLDIFDAGGRRVRSFVERQQDAGAHSLVWDGRDDRGRDLPSGVYTVRLVTGDGARTQRLLKIR